MSKKKLLILLSKNIFKISNFEKALKRAKTLKTQRKKTSFFLGAFTWERIMSLIKIACFVLNFLNLKSKPRQLFLGSI